MPVSPVNDVEPIILKATDEATGNKFVEAIRGCGGVCELQVVGADDWSLTAMTKANIVDFFICPSCEHEEEIERGTKRDVCPECGLVIAKWEEKMREEAEKEKSVDACFVTPGYRETGAKNSKRNAKSSSGCRH